MSNDVWVNGQPADIIYLCPELLDHYYSVSVIAAQHERIEYLEAALVEARHETDVQRARAERWRERAERVTA